MSRRVRRFYLSWRILLWKAILMRRHSPVTSALEIAIPVVLSLQIRLMFDPLALHTQELDKYTKEEMLASVPEDTRFWYVPKHAFVDELMTKAARKLRTTIQAADSERSLVLSHYSTNESSRVLWAIFDVDQRSTGTPRTLEYKIRSSDVGRSKMIMMHEEEPAAKDPYITSGFIALQLAIESTFVEMWTNAQLPKMGDNLTIGRFPFYKADFLVVPSTVRPNISVIYYMAVVAFILLPVATLQKVIHDKETGFRGLMTLMDASHAVLYVGWLSYLMITALPVTIACTTLLYPVFTNTYALVIALFVASYVTLSTLFVLALGSFFGNSTKASLTASFFWLFLAHATVVLDQLLVRTPLAWRALSLVLPHSGLLYGLVAFTSRSDLQDRRGDALKRLLDSASSRVDDRPSRLWPRWVSEMLTLRDAYDLVHAEERISVPLILVSWALHITFWYLLAIYLDYVNPGQFGSARPWYYVCKKTARNDDDVDLTFRGSTNWSAVEQTPSFIKSSVRVRCVTKTFGRIGDRLTALNQVTIDFYQREFSVILGHNGAGKSCLLKIITGMYEPTHGHVYIEGRDYNGAVELNGRIGYCPQENILVNYLTPMQHVYMFGMMKGMTYTEARAETLSLFRRLDLEPFKDAKVKHLSPGTQRRVSLAMALIGRTEILVLDEPIYGLDPAHRRLVWDLLSSIKRTKTILMATNSMEAADVLSDRIAIIANGSIECYGTKMYLNRRYGIGYILSLLLHEDCDVERLRAEIQEFSSESIASRGRMGLVARFDVPRNTRFTKLLQHLESNKERLNVVSVALDAASIEGQFLRIGLTSRFKERSMIYPASQYEIVLQQRRRHLLRSAKPWTRLTGRALWRQQVLTMFCKKLLHVRSSCKLYVYSITLAIIVLVLTTMISELSSFSLFETTEITMNLTYYVDNNLHVLYYAADSKPSMDFLVALYTTSESYSDRRNYHISRNVTATDLMIHPDLHSIEFRDRYVMSADVLADGRIDLMYSSTAVHSGPIAINTLHNALLRYHCGSGNCGVRLSSRPLVNPKQWQHRLVHPRSIRTWENAAIAVSLFLLLPTLDLGVRELGSLSKLLQTNTVGVSTSMYWMPIYVVDLLIYSAFVLALAALIVAAYRGVMQFPVMDVVHVVLIFLCYGAAAIPLGYCVQLLTSKAENVYTTVVSINVVAVLLVNGSMIFPLVFRVVGDAGRYLLESSLHALPPYALSCALSNYIVLNLYNRQCSRLNTCATELRVEDPCCQNCGDRGCYKPLDVMLFDQSGAEYHHSVIDDVLLMVAQTFAFHLLLEFFEEKNRRKWRTSRVSADGEDVELAHQEVAEEKETVRRHMNHYAEANSLPGSVALLVHDLRKDYHRRPVVRGVNFAIHRQECFGLLGINGAGKSTIFRMLTGQTRITAGRVVMLDREFASDQDAFAGMAGYCPQTGGLSDFLTGRQCLKLHAALRGVPYGSVADEVDKWLDVLDSLNFENLKIEHYPWGVQRKFCVLQSLVGDLPMVFLDEPSSGIDVITRHAMCDVLHQVREMGRSLLITTHNMREAEAMCLRVGVLVDGQFVAIGSCEDLKEKHGSNFTVSLKVSPGLRSENVETVKRIIDDAFPGVRFKDGHMGVLKYELDGDLPFSNVFDTLEKLRARYPWITDFSVNQPSMDQVFLELAKVRREEPRRASFRERLWAWITGNERGT